MTTRGPHGRFITWDDTYASKHPELRQLLEAFVGCALDEQPADAAEYGAHFFCRSRSELRWELWRSRGRLRSAVDAEANAGAERSRQALIAARAAYYAEKRLELQRGANGGASSQQPAARSRPRTANASLPPVHGAAAAVSALAARFGLSAESETDGGLLAARSAYFKERRRLLADMPNVPNGLVFEWTETQKQQNQPTQPPSLQPQQRGGRGRGRGGGGASILRRPFSAPAAANCQSLLRPKPALRPMAQSLRPHALLPAIAGAAAAANVQARSTGPQKGGLSGGRLRSSSSSQPESESEAKPKLELKPEPKPYEEESKKSQKTAVATCEVEAEDAAAKDAAAAAAARPPPDAQTLSNQWFEMSMLLRGAVVADALQFAALKARVCDALEGLASIESAARRSGVIVGKLFQALLQRLSQEGDESGGGIARDVEDYDAAAAGVNALAEGDAWAPLAAAAAGARALVRIKLEDSNDLLAARQALEFCVQLFADVERLAVAEGKSLDATLALLE